MMIKDSYLLAASKPFELKDRQEKTVNIELTKAPPCYHTLLTGSVLNKNKPISKAVVKVFDCKYNPLFHTVTNGEGVYQFKNILAPGQYKVVAAADNYPTSEAQNIKIKERKPVKKDFQLKKCSIFSYGILYGKIRESVTQKPISEASIYLKDGCGLVYKTTSNTDGQYIFYDIKPEQYHLTVKKRGYKSLKPLELNIDKNDRIMLYIDMQRSCDRYNKTISGVFTCADKPVPDAPVFLYQLDSKGYETLAKFQVTNEDGAFLFSNLDVGTFILKGKQQSKDICENKDTLQITGENKGCHTNDDD